MLHFLLIWDYVTMKGNRLGNLFIIFNLVCKSFVESRAKQLVKVWFIKHWLVGGYINMSFFKKLFAPEDLTVEEKERREQVKAEKKAQREKEQKILAEKITNTLDKEQPFHIDYCFASNTYS